MPCCSTGWATSSNCSSTTPRRPRRRLDIALTKRGEDGGEPMPMCGVPVHAAEAYLARLIRAGHRVAIAEQIESPAEARKARGSKALVERAIVRLVTPGTLTEETLLDSGAANWLAAVGAGRRRLGDRRRRHFDRAVRAGRLRAGRAEVRAGAAGAGRNDRRRQGAGHCDRRPARAGSTASPASGRSRRASGSRRSTASASPGRAELAAAGGLLAYLDATQKDAAPSSPRRAGSRATRAYGDRPRDPRQPGDLPHPDGQRRRQPARRRSTAASPRRAPAARRRPVARR